MDTRECSANLKSGSALHYTSKLPTMENIGFKEESCSIQNLSCRTSHKNGIQQWKAKFHLLMTWTFVLLHHHRVHRNRTSTRLEPFEKEYVHLAIMETDNTASTNFVYKMGTIIPSFQLLYIFDI